MTKLELAYTMFLAVIAIVVLIYFIITAIKKGWIKALTKTLNESIRYAEKNINGKGQKKQYVMSQIEFKCDELGIPYYLIKDIISKLIDKIIHDHNIIDHEDEQ